MSRRTVIGSPEPLGVTPDDRGINVAVFSRHATAIELCLFDDADREIERHRLPGRTGDIFHGHIADIAEGARYGLRAHGPFAPLEGHRFNPAKLLVDPYALAIDRPFRLHPSMLGYRPDDPAVDLGFDATDSSADVPKAVVTALKRPRPPARRPRVPWSDTLIYELHVRGFTKRHPDVPEPLRGTFAGLAHPAAIAHLAALGITSVELMPVAAFIDERHLPALGLTDYWGYNPMALMAPDPRLAPGGWPEVRAAVDALHAAGLEVILDIVLNHSGESDELGPTLSFRGLDNASYYRLPEHDRRHYVNDTGCGNCLALDDPAVLRLAMDTLRTWATQADLDGFRFDLATALGRRANGFDPASPLLVAIGQDPVLRELKLIAEPWDIGPGGYQAGNFPPAWGEWNDRFRDGLRRFWRGDPSTVGELATRLAGSQDLFGRKPGPSRSINFVTAHDGFTLADLVSYAGKHNEANGEGNRDGTDANFSWNHGIEGPSDEPSVVAARLRDQRNLLATLLLARGTPMLAMGSELGHSQRGNNNAYAQDNETSWLDWATADGTLTQAVQRLIALRRAHPALRRDLFLTGEPLDGSGIPDVAWLTADGRPMSAQDWENPATRTLVVVLAAPDEGGKLDRVALILHAGPDPMQVRLPEPGPDFCWRLELDTARPDRGPSGPQDLGADHTVEVAPRSLLLFSEARSGARRRPTDDPEAVARLAEMAGIAAEWWDVGGTRHVVSAETKRALLAAMGFAAGSGTEARDSLAALNERRRRPLPHAIVCREGESIRLLPASGSSLPQWLRIEREDGSTEHLRVNAETGQRSIEAPAQPIGRHRLFLDDRPDCICELTVAPPRCFLPPSIAEGGKRFGIAAHLYTLRRAGDQGIGDFTTLGRLAELAAAEGAALVGLNPLHALFPSERERASPYFPSDRRFIDPIYIDIAALEDVFTAIACGAPPPLDGTAIAALSSGREVDYPRVWALKSAALERCFEAFDRARHDRPDGSPARDFADFVTRGSTTLQRFACFEALGEAQAGRPWPAWPAAFRDAGSQEVAAFAAAHAARVRYHQFLQWLCERQLAAVSRAETDGLEIGLYRDLAIGAAPDGAEAWAESALLARGAVIGSPPDPFSAEGQVWNLPPLNPLALHVANFRPFVEAVAANMRHAGALRIDHVMGLTRLFLVPEGGSAREGAYVAYPFEDLLGQVALESVRHRCLVVGEDLGTVPEGFRERLGRADVLSYRVLWFEREGQGFKPPAAYPARAVACVSTHDLPTLAGWWACMDIAERRVLGLIDEAQEIAERSARQDEKRALLDALQREGLIEAPPDLGEPLSLDLAAAVHAYIARSPAALVLVQADDLAGETMAVNLPGTDRERANWRRRLEGDVDELALRGRPVLAALREGRPGLTGTARKNSSIVPARQS